MKKVFKIISLFSVVTVLVASFLVPQIGRAANSSVDVGLIVSNCGNGIVDSGETCDAGSGNNGACPKTCSASCTTQTCGGGGGGEPSDTPPNIYNIASTVGFDTANLSWSVSDDHAVSAVSFVYGITTSYGSVGVVTGGYQVSLSGLTTATTYYYKITATDNIGQVTNYSGSFTTFFVDLVGPVISNVTTTAGVTVATVKFDTNELATSEVSYGLLNDHEGTASGGGAAVNHTIILSNLLPNRTYLFQIITTDLLNNSTSQAGLSFKTLPDVAPPPNVTNFQLTTTTNSIILNWTNPSFLSVPDFSGVKILRSTNSPVVGYNDPGAIVKYTGSGETMTDTAVLSNVSYYYSVFSFDTSGNYSSGVSKVGKIVENLYEVCGNGIDDDNNGKIDCVDDACKDLFNCIVSVEICNNGIDDDNNGKIDCADPVCTSVCQIVITEICGNGIDDDNNGQIDCVDSVCASVCFPGSGEICGNGIDDDNNGQIDCADLNCSSFSGCQVKQCDNKIDDDGDGLIDFPSDPGCVNNVDNDEYSSPSSTVPGFARVNFSNLEFFTGNRQIKLVAQNNTVTSLSGSSLTLAVPASVLVGTPAGLVFRVDGQSYQFVFSNGVYHSEIIFPNVGKHDAYLEVDYGGGQFDSVPFFLDGLSRGEVRGDDTSLSGAEVSLFQSDGSLIYLGVYGEQNPLLTDVNGLYGWVVQNGQYYLRIQKDGFFERITPVFYVNNNVVNQNISLIQQPPKLLEIIDPNATVGENAVKIAKNLLDKTSALSQVSLQVANDVADNPVVEKAASEVVAPAAVGVAAVGTAAASWFDLVSLLRFLFLQPLVLLSRGKRKKWGSVYNSLTKLPVDLAIVRLFNAETNKLVQSRVTDGEGRYAFIVGQGKYRLEAQKGNLVFPSVLLKGFKDDGDKLDVYHGENIEVTGENSLITANIPLDPVGETKTPKRILREKLGRRFQNGFSWLGFVVTGLSLYVSPVWYMWILLVVHLFFLFAFRRLIKPKRAKGWGIVYDTDTAQPVARVVARLFDSQFNKLVATEVTDRNGRYHFLAGGSKYYVTYEHKDYEPTKLEMSGLVKKGEGAITEDVKIKKKSG